MPNIRVKEGDNPEFALRKFKRSCEKAGIITDARSRKFYEKPTAKRKRKKIAAIKRHLKKIMRDTFQRSDLRRR